MCTRGVLCSALVASVLYRVASCSFSLVPLQDVALRRSSRISNAAATGAATAQEAIPAVAPVAEKFLDLEALLAGASNDAVVEDDGSAPEAWENMVERMHFEGNQNEANFRPPAPVPSSYIEENGMQEVNVAEVLAALEHDPTSVELWDVRDPEEYAMGHASQARNVPFDSLADANAARALSGSQSRLHLICSTGARSAQAQVRLVQVYGARDVTSVIGGLMAWEMAGADLVTST